MCFVIHIITDLTHSSLNDHPLQEGGRLVDELLDRFAIRSGVSGVQPKLLLSAHNEI